LNQAKVYITHFPVRSYLEAQILSKESTWNITEYIRRVGAKGASADEISRDLILPPSLVYQTLKELYRLEYVFVYPREKRARTERKKRYVYDWGWGKYGVDREFADALALDGVLHVVNEILKESLLRALSEVQSICTERKELNRFIPTVGDTSLCPRCNRNHEAMEFFYAVILKAVDEFIGRSPEFHDFLLRFGYAKQSLQAIRE